MRPSYVFVWQPGELVWNQVMLSLHLASTRLRTRGGQKDFQKVKWKAELVWVMTVGRQKSVT